MNRFTGFEHGMGIGGWLTNYKRFHVLPEHRRLCLTIGDMEHFATYIQERDISYIASLGMDHIRLGFDQIVVETEPGILREEVMQHIDSFISWCKKYNLNIVLNLHKAIGNYCDVPEPIQLLDDDGLQERFILMWEKFEERYHNDNEIAFEILNEVKNVDPEKWNDLAEKTIKAIRKLNAERKIIIGSTCWNSPNTLPQLRVYDDPNVIYTFHIYSPFEFTHQRGVLQQDPLYYNRTMPYPCDIERYRDYYDCLYGKKDAYPNYDKMDIKYMRDCMQPAVDFVKNNPDKILWCGEFGTIRHAKIEWRENWMRDVITILKENEIPYCVWNYLSTPNDGNRFSLVDDDKREIISEELARVIRGEV